MAFCTNCGAPLQSGARFCRECGTAVVTETAPVSVAVSASSSPPASEPAPAPAPRVRPVVPAMTVGDFVRDGLAAFALIASLFMVWQHTTADAFGSHDPMAATRIDVILITLLSLVSLGIPYLWRAGVFGAGWNYAKTQDARILANAPYAIMVLVYVIIELFTRNGLGPAVAFGLAGAILAAQPRQAEVVAGDTVRNKRWIGVVIALVAMVAILTVVQIGAVLLSGVSYGFVGILIVVIILAMTSVVILATIAMGITRLDYTWRLIGISLGIFAALFGLLSLSPDITLITTEFWGGVPAFTLTFWLAFGAAASAPSIASVMKERRNDAASWLGSARTVVALAIGVTAVIVVVSLIELIGALTLSYASSLSTVSGPLVLALFFGVIGVVGGVVTRAMLAAGTRQSYLVGSAYAALLFVLGLVLVIVWSIQGLGVAASLILILAFGLPLGLIALLWGSAASREHFVAVSAAARQSASVPPLAPEQVAVKTPADIDAIRAEASNPQTPALRLQEIASSVPEARAAIAANPSAYPELLAWLATLGQPDIDEALSQSS